MHAQTLRSNPSLSCKRPASAETQQTCVYQCLVQDGANARDCITALSCDEAFERNVQACLQERTIAPPLYNVERFAATCRRTYPHRHQFLVPPRPLKAVRPNAVQLTTPASVACGGQVGCALSTESIQTCEMANAQAPLVNLDAFASLNVRVRRTPLVYHQVNSTHALTTVMKPRPRKQTMQLRDPCDENYLNAYECLETVSP